MILPFTVHDITDYNCLLSFAICAAINRTSPVPGRKRLPCPNQIYLLAKSPSGKEQRHLRYVLGVERPNNSELFCRFDDIARFEKRCVTKFGRTTSSNWIVLDDDLIGYTDIPINKRSRHRTLFIIESTLWDEIVKQTEQQEKNDNYEEE